MRLKNKPNYDNKVEKSATDWLYRQGMNEREDDMYFHICVKAYMAGWKNGYNKAKKELI